MKYYLITFGCQMNESDSERISFELENLGYQQVLSFKDADLIIVNMCSVRQSAVNRVYGLINKFSIFKKTNPLLKLGLTGCILKKDKKKFKKYFDFIFNIKDTPYLKEIINQKHFKSLENPLPYLNLKPKTSSKISAYLPIMTGCNNFCSYCVVPFTREREFSRPVSNIISEVKFFLEKDYKQIILLGQNVNSYQDGKTDFSKLLKEICNLPEKFWLSFLTSHPKDLSEELIKTMSQEEKIIEYLHLPVQSGSNKILKKMNRNYSIKHYKNLIKKIRKTNPNIAISTDIIVGFPGETKKQFKKTAKLLKQIKFDMVYVARYSPRPETTAFKMNDNVSQKEKQKREKELYKILENTAFENNKKYLHKKIDVLVKKEEEKYYFAQTKSFKNVKVKKIPKKNLIPGEFVKIVITKIDPWGLTGEFI